MLTDKVFHHDEGVNGNFMVSLFRNGYYHYDPANYHGPTLYYAALLTTSIASFFAGKAGLNDFTLRIVTVIFGMGVVWLLLGMKSGWAVLVHWLLRPLPPFLPGLSSSRAISSTKFFLSSLPWA